MPEPEPDAFGELFAEAQALCQVVQRCYPDAAMSPNQCEGPGEGASVAWSAPTDQAAEELLACLRSLPNVADLTPWASCNASALEATQTCLVSCPETVDACWVAWSEAADQCDDDVDTSSLIGCETE